MDTGHYNCRDYLFGPHFAATTITNDREHPRSQHKFGGSGNRVDHVLRHESFEELEQRSRSPASKQPKFPLLLLPIEIRQQIFSYLLPRTIEQPPQNPLSEHARNFRAVQKRAAKGMPLPLAAGESSSLDATTSSSSSPRAIVWQRGNVKLLSVCRQLHEECADLLYGGMNTFLLFVTYAGIVFRFSWLLSSGLSPQRRYPFLELLPPRYLMRIKRLSINIEHVDGYTGMIKFNVSEQGLVQGLRKQVHRLVVALLAPPVPVEFAAAAQGDASLGVEEQDANLGERRSSIAKVHVRVSTSSSVIDELKRLRQAGGATPSTVVKNLEHMLAPLECLSDVRDVAVTGAVPTELAMRLCRSMTQHQDDKAPSILKRPSEENLGPLLCVYGNDI